jgi:LysM repeat protein
MRYNRFRPVLMQARSTGEPELLQAQRRRREQRDADRPNGARRPRRRRHSTPWLQRNALSIAGVSLLIAFLGLGFGLVQTLNRSDSATTPLTLAQNELPGATAGPSVITASTLGSSGEANAPDPSSPSAGGAHAIRASAKVLDPNYTIASGDTLVKIAQRFNTTVERIQAFNNLSDPRALRIGTKLVIPPPLQS